MSKSVSKLFDEEEQKAMQDGDMNEPNVEEKIQEYIAEQQSEVKELADEVSNAMSTPVQEPFDDSIQDIQIDAARKKKFRINGDNNKIIELDVGDVGVSYRLTEAYDRLNDLMRQVSVKLQDVRDDDDDDESAIKIAEGLKELDDSMKKEIDFIFNADVAEKCSNGSSMYKPYNGMFVYEHIIDVVTDLYETNLNSEFNKLRRRVAETTQKYARGKSPTKKYARH